MVENLTYNQFCNKYYETAKEMSVMTIMSYEKKYDTISNRADLDSVVSLAVSYALEKTYTHYDVDHESQAGVKTYLSTVVRNCTLTEISKEKKSIRLTEKPKAPESDPNSPIISFIPQSGTKQGITEDYGRIGYAGTYERKEDIIRHMLQCMKQLPPIDQVILTKWMYNQKTYISDSLDALGMEHTKANENVIGVRCNRAKKNLGKLMGEKPNYREMSLDAIPYVHVIDSEDEATEMRKKETYSTIAKSVDYISMERELSVDSE